jgi:hypothetical protein
MRKLGLLIIGVVLALGVVAPATAAPPEKYKYASSSANAFWYFTDQPARNVTVNTTWYVGVYQSTDGTFSDLYVDTETCRTAGRRVSCTYTSKYGFSDLSGAVFTIDTTGLTAAHLEATYDLQTFDDNGNVTSTEPSAIVADWEGIGDIESSSGKFSYCDQYACSRTTFTNDFRYAEATGSVNGSDLGETYDAYLSNGAERDFYRAK